MILIKLFLFTTNSKDEIEFQHKFSFPQNDAVLCTTKKISLSPLTSSSWKRRKMKCFDKGFFRTKCYKHLDIIFHREKWEKKYIFSFLAYASLYFLFLAMKSSEKRTTNDAKKSAINMFCQRWTRKVISHLKQFFRILFIISSCFFFFFFLFHFIHKTTLKRYFTVFFLLQIYIHKMKTKRKSNHHKMRKHIFHAHCIRVIMPYALAWLLVEKIVFKTIVIESTWCLFTSIFPSIFVYSKNLKLFFSPHSKRWGKTR